MFRTVFRIPGLLLVAACLAASPASAGSSRDRSQPVGSSSPLLQAYPGG